MYAGDATVSDQGDSSIPGVEGSHRLLVRASAPCMHTSKARAMREAGEGFGGAGIMTMLMCIGTVEKLTMRLAPLEKQVASRRYGPAERAEPGAHDELLYVSGLVGRRFRGACSTSGSAGCTLPLRVQRQRTCLSERFDPAVATVGVAEMDRVCGGEAGGRRSAFCLCGAMWKVLSTSGAAYAVLARVCGTARVPRCSRMRTAVPFGGGRTGVHRCPEDVQHIDGHEEHAAEEGVVDDVGNGGDNDIGGGGENGDRCMWTAAHVEGAERGVSSGTTVEEGLQEFVGVGGFDERWEQQIKGWSLPLNQDIRTQLPSGIDTGIPEKARIGCKTWLQSSKGESLSKDPGGR
ncbi:hypothetical protein B0H17DRAFT_1129570 [Mycena rosella]|uniref:Uncharacterized protein n=1 Tax=Mycena rosella TaxID=1033263 RepID=A0AAD7GPG5_MYCRO|nr:hypothetical protein B0H17DRAFT_1129570 [Mycena rosella]